MRFADLFHSFAPRGLGLKTARITTVSAALAVLFGASPSVHAQSLDESIRADPPSQPVEAAVTYVLPNNKLTPTIAYYTLLANMLAQRGKGDEAFKINMQLAYDTRDPRYAETAYRLALQANAANGAIAAADLLKTLAPNAVLGQNLSNQLKITDGYAQLDVMQYRAAYASAQQILSKSPNNTEALSLLGEAAARLGLESEATAAFEQLVKIAPDNPDNLNALGYYLADRNIRLREAEKLITKAHNAQPNSGSITDSMAWLAYRQGRLSDALTLIDKAAAQNQHEDVFIHQAEILWANNQQAQAIEVLREVYVNKPLLPMLRDTMERLGVTSADLRVIKSTKTPAKAN